MKSTGKNDAESAEVPDDRRPEDWLANLAISRWSEAEIAARRRALSDRTAELDELDQELALNAVLDARPAAPRASSNFSARVLERIELEDRAAARPRAPRPGFWATWLRPVMGLSLLAGSLTFGWKSYQAYHRHHIQLLAQGASTLAFSANAPELTPESLENYEVIRRLGATPQPDDEALIAALVEVPVR